MSHPRSEKHTVKLIINFVENFVDNALNHEYL